jgi:hypothetical protein
VTSYPPKVARGSYGAVDFVDRPMAVSVVGPAGRRMVNTSFRALRTILSEFGMLERLKVKLLSSIILLNYLTSHCTENTGSFVPDVNGWVHHPDGGLLFWVPDDCRNGLACPSVLTIPTTGRNRMVRMDTSDFCYGSSWTDIQKRIE